MIEEEKKIAMSGLMEYVRNKEEGLAAMCGSAGTKAGLTSVCSMLVTESEDAVEMSCLRLRPKAV